jgi:hypothetical protein
MLTAEQKKRVAVACCPAEELWQWEIRADGPCEVWKKSGVHRKVWNPEYYTDHFSGLVRETAQLIRDEHRSSMLRLQESYAGHLCIRIQGRAVTLLQYIATGDTEAIQQLCFELLDTEKQNPILWCNSDTDPERNPYG